MIRADSRRLRSRLRNLTSSLPIVADMALEGAARMVVNSITAAVRSEWSRNNQVGFNVDNFISIISDIDKIPGGWGALSTEKMGDEPVFERIKGIKGLWHQGTRQGRKFGEFINQEGMFFNQVGELEGMRKAIWGNKEPQWWLIEHGTTGVAGAWDARPPTNTIMNTTLKSIPKVYSTIQTSVKAMLRQRGIV